MPSEGYCCRAMAAMGQVNLVTERKRRRLGKVEAAKAIGISFNTLALVEAGGEPRRDVQDKIAAFYGIDPLVIWPVDEEPPIYGKVGRVP